MKGSTALGLALLALVVAAWAAGLVSSYDVVADVNPLAADLPPGPDNLLGTDHLGRDVLWRLVVASQAFVGPGLLATAVAAAAGVPVGALAGVLGGLPAQGLRFGLGAVASVPGFVWALLAATIFGPRLTVLAVAAGLAYAPALAEDIHSRIEALHRAEFVLAARAHGLSEAAILGRHLLWVSCRRLVARHLLHLFAFFLALETSLSYIGGFGVSEPMPSWGNMLAFSFGWSGNPWATLAPALALWGTALGLGLVARALAEEAHG